MTAKLLLWMAAIFAAAIQHSEPIRVLGLFPHPGISHFHFFHPIMRGLADVGHDVTVVSYFPDPTAPANYKDLPLKEVATLKNSVDLAVCKYDGCNVVDVGGGGEGEKGEGKKGELEGIRGGYFEGDGVMCINRVHAYAAYHTTSIQSS